MNEIDQRLHNQVCSKHFSKIVSFFFSGRVVEDWLVKVEHSIYRNTRYDFLVQLETSQTNQDVQENYFILTTWHS